MSSELTSGQLLLDRYRLDRRLGEGGMSVVWAGTHVVTGKQVALKLLKSEASGDEATRRRMLREARAACAVVHRNVVQIHDVLELPSGAPVLVMDLLSGESLRDRLQRRRTLSVSETATLLVPVVSAAGTAHAAGVIHRDLKPDNIHLAEEDGDLCVKVLDFGIAKLVETGNNASQINALTNTGTMLGTPYYMAPEQILGEPIDHRIDIWALGVILYECLAGERPTEAENIGKILKRVLTNEIEPLTARCPQLPREVTTLVDRMLSQNAASRPSMREIGETLTPFANGVTLGSFGPPTLAADPDITEDRPAPPPRKKPAPLPPGGSTAELAETLIAGRPDDLPSRSPHPDTPSPANADKPSSAATDNPSPTTGDNPSPTTGDKPSRSAAGSEDKPSRARERDSSPSPDPQGKPSSESEKGPSPEATLAAPSGGSRRSPALLAAVVGGILVAGAVAGYTLSRNGNGRAAYVPATASMGVSAGKGPCPDGMGHVPGGKYRMGSDDGKDDERPVHEVTLAPYCMDLTEVKASDYFDCMQQGLCRQAESTVRWMDVTDEVKERESLHCTLYQTEKKDYPMNCVSWSDADAFCKAQGKRLPTEAEWEYAAAGGNERRKYPWGSAPPAPDLANVCDRSCVEAANETSARPMFDADDGAPTLAPTGSYKRGASRFGMLDMAGNVWEWTASPYCTYPDHACQSQYRVFRGGGWGGKFTANLRAAARIWSHPSHRYNDVGFRCVSDLR